MPDLKSSILSLPYIAAAQAQKHVTHNEALAQLDLLVQLSVISFDVTNAPVSPAEGDVYTVGAGAVGDFAGQDAGTIAVFQEGAWAFEAPKSGWVAGEGGASTVRVWDGTVWAPVGGGFPSSVGTLGINATADAINRLSINAEATLLNHDGAGHQLKLNKVAPVDTASLLFQTGFSGRAEMGTAGSDDFFIKVSADGTAWNEAISIDALSGDVTMLGLSVSGPARLGNFTVTTLPSASGAGAGAIIYVSDESGGAVTAFSDGSAWRRTTDRAIVS
ncbi:MAG: DUF2793 domain-containing protein [Rhodobacteraceae bacterium]|nr:DUF2793 domain-containing protein [Paracoccaceae bacterium]